MKLKIITSILLLSFSTVSFADISKSDYNFMKKEQDDLNEFKSSLSDKTFSLPTSQREQVNGLINQIQERQNKSQANTEEKKPTNLYFVSFSIPDDGILIMLKDANHYHLAPTIRGLIDNDFRKTAVKMFDLSKEDKTIGVQIDPTLFLKYDIKAVPVLVISCGSHYDKIYGSLPIKDALTRIAKDGDCKDEASKLLRGDGQ
ncbi:type-F conjugative transfer system pilin assembly protein TrbC [Rouxiella silvae]|uniref:Type-F conjugative transfer system pilin assembly protein TrbC n=1 Tax=Rouxiella silvae TaxID=1646373 RepID=A0ABX3TVJ4_9GAMM|nr:type-F conjugative transfer system pilin assembly protein TrbC [Rouxiella silvae]ORJ19226.1 type-F conjugative transfer system pilin assembly protein TrbC [Rouxiella silvae]